MNRSAPRSWARLYLVRHALAGTRSDRPDDPLRPLEAEGMDRARALVELLRERAGGDIVSSPFTRCVETVAPLATSLRQPVAISDALAEEAELTAILDLLSALPDGSVACTHGDVLLTLAPELEDARPRRENPIRFDKGVVWVLAREGLSLSLVDELGPTTGATRRDTPGPQECAAALSAPRPSKEPRP